MEDKRKNIIITFSFVIILIIFTIINIITNDKEISKSERRKLKQLPSLNKEEILSGEYFKELEKYFLDQYFLRDYFRKIKAMSEVKLFGKKDNNSYFEEDDNLFKIPKKLDEASIKKTANFYNFISGDLFENNNVFYSIIPEKYHYLNTNINFEKNYEKIKDLMLENAANMKYIDITKDLDLSDYYKTDIHWSQDKIIKVGDEILKGLSCNNKTSDYKFEIKEYFPFYGSYYGSSISSIKPDRIRYLTNEIIEKCIVYDYETKKTTKIYDERNLDNMDAYDVFLGGPKALLKIKNPNSKYSRTLYIFRDSFGSSLVPLLISEYSEITLIDLRYININQLKDYITLNSDYDVLFILNTQIMNESNLFIR